MSSEEQSQDTLNIVNATFSDKFTQKVADQYARNIEKYAPMDAYIIKVKGEDKKFKRRKILGGEHKILEVLRQKLAREIQTRSMHAAETEDLLYKKCAFYYLIDAETGNGMSDEQFDFVVFEDIKPILDACSYRTEKPIPPLE